MDEEIDVNFEHDSVIDSLFAQEKKCSKRQNQILLMRRKGKKQVTIIRIFLM